MAHERSSTPTVEAIVSGDRRALARALTLLEARDPAAHALSDALARREPPRARRLGITGPPGAGKSTLAAALIAHCRAAGESVALLAVDPSSPFSGGALLGDRVRLRAHASDAQVFVRSMASRGTLGGLAPAALDAVELLAHAGFDTVLVETVGVGQAEVAVARACDTVLVVLSPESGDGIQAMKAGILEIADLLVVNKADREGAERLKDALEFAVHLAASPAQPADTAAGAADTEPSAPDARAFGDDDPEITLAGFEPWLPPVLLTVATDATGIEAVWEAADRHQRHARASGSLARRHRERLRDRARARIEAAVLANFWRERQNEFASALDAAASGRENLDALVERLVAAAPNLPSASGRGAGGEGPTSTIPPAACAAPAPAPEAKPACEAGLPCEPVLALFLRHELRDLLNRYTREALLGTGLLTRESWTTANGPVGARHPYFAISTRLIDQAISHLAQHLADHAANHDRPPTKP